MRLLLTHSGTKHRYKSANSINHIKDKAIFYLISRNARDNNCSRHFGAGFDLMQPISALIVGHIAAAALVDTLSRTNIIGR